MTYLLEITLHPTYIALGFPVEETIENSLGNGAGFFYAHTVFREAELAFALQLHFKYANRLLQLLQLK